MALNIQEYINTYNTHIDKPTLFRHKDKTETKTQLEVLAEGLSNATSLAQVRDAAKSVLQSKSTEE